LFEDPWFERVQNSVKLRKEGRVLTDVDAAVFDSSTNSLALFQLKWQDYNTSDIKQIFSRTKNFVSALNTWTATVQDWLSSADTGSIRSAFKLRHIRDDQPLRIFLFGLSYSISRAEAFAKIDFHGDLAVANWGQFFFAYREQRFEKELFQRLHAQFRKETRLVLRAQPTEVRLQVGENELVFENYWFLFDDEAPESDALVEPG
jgi:hypothetical protein